MTFKGLETVNRSKSHTKDIASSRVCFYFSQGAVSLQNSSGRGERTFPKDEAGSYQKNADPIQSQKLGGLDLMQL